MLCPSVISRGYSEQNLKPLLESSPEKDGDDWGAGWGDDWGEDSASSNSSHSKGTSPPPAQEKWDSWSNEKTSPGVAGGKPKEADDWNQGWEETGFDAKSNSKPHAKPNSKASKGHANHKARTVAGANESEPATANLIDLGGAGAGKAAADKPADGWDNDAWAAEDAEWQSLDVSSNNQRNIIKRD